MIDGAALIAELKTSDIFLLVSCIKELAIESAILELEGNLDNKIQENLDETQKEFILKEKLNKKGISTIVETTNLSDFLNVNGVPYDKLLVNISDKAQQCLLEDIDLFIDDNNDNCRAVHKAGVDTLQFGTLFTKKLKNIERVESWQEVYNYIQNNSLNLALFQVQVGYVHYLE